ncbi:MAG: hypothetical protein JOZ39_03050, partial [Chloroflexi bacterium]|nr:hypothetical protein [Chloroflexota bacterium]
MSSNGAKHLQGPAGHRPHEQEILRIVTYEDVESIIDGLPGVTVGARWRNRTWFVGKTGFAWERPFSKADITRFGDQTPPAGPILAVRLSDLEEKEAVLATSSPAVFNIA